MVIATASRFFSFLKKHTAKIPGSLWGIWFIKPPEDVSLNGYRIDGIIQYTDFIITLYFGIVVLALLYFIFRYRARPGHQAVYDKGDSKKHLAVTLALGLIVFLTVDVVIETRAFRDLREAFWNFPQGDDVLRVEVLPQQYAWNFRYAGADGEFGTDDDLVPSQNQMHIPVNTPVVIQLSPYDVIHSFYLPNFRVKQDATPGMVTAMWFQATKTGSFEIACAELCGNAHYRMKGYLTIESREDFDRWLSGLEPEGLVEDDVWEELLEEETPIPTKWGWAWKEVL